MKNLSQSVDRRLRPVIRRESRGHGKGRNPFMSFRRRAVHRCPKIVVYDPRTGNETPGPVNVTWDGDTAWVAWTPQWQVSRDDILLALRHRKVAGLLAVLDAQPALAGDLADAILDALARNTRPPRGKGSPFRSLDRNTR